MSPDRPSPFDPRSVAGGLAKPARSWPYGRCLLLFAAVWLAFCWPWLAGGMTIPWDAKAHFYPQLVFLADALNDGQSPFWTNYVFGGHPQIADPQSLIFSPPYLLLALFNSAPSMTAMDIAAFAILGFGGLGVIALFADRRWHWAGAVIAALCFAFGAAAAWRVQHIGQVMSLAYLPIAFVCLDRALKRRSVVYGFAAGAVAAFMVLGRDQVALLGCYLLAAFVLGHWLTRRRPFGDSLAPLSAATLTGVLIVTLPLLMSLLFAEQSNRPEIDLEGAGRGSLHPAHLLTLFIPDIFGSSGPQAEVWGPPSFAWNWTGLFLAQNMFVMYVGAIPILLILSRVASLWRAEIRPFTLASLFLLTYALGWYTPLFALYYKLMPGVALYRRPADALFLIGALLGVLAGYALHRLLTEDKDRSFVRVLIAALASLAALAMSITLALSFERLPGKADIPLVTGAICLSLAMAAIAIGEWKGARHPRLIALAVIMLTGADLIWNNGVNPSTGLPLSDYAVLDPQSDDPIITTLRDKLEAREDEGFRDRIELVGLGFHWPNASLVHGFDHTLGYNPLRDGIYSAAVGAEDTIGLPDQRKFTALFPSYASRLANLLGLRFIVSPIPIEAVDKALPEGSLSLIGRPGGAYLYENPNTLPRAFLVTGAVAADTQTLVKTGAWPESDPLDAVVLERLPADFRSKPGRGQARIVSYSNTDIVIEADAPEGGGFVVLNDAFNPWWFADIDGNATDILRANTIFRAVRVPAGQSRLRMSFHPLLGVLRQLWHKMR